MRVISTCPGLGHNREIRYFIRQNIAGNMKHTNTKTCESSCKNVVIAVARRVTPDRRAEP